MHHLTKRVTSTTPLARPARLADPQPHLGLPRARREPRARRGGGAARDQRLRRGDGRAGLGFAELEGRRLDRVRLLDLLRRLRRRRQPGAPPRARRPRRARRLGVAGVGVGVAGQPPHALQPRLRRPRGQAVVRAQALVWWDEDEERWTGYDVPDFPVDKRPDYQPRAGRQGMDAISGDRAVHHDGRRPGLAVLARGLLDGPMPTHYEPWSRRWQPAVPGGRRQPGAIPWKRAGQPDHATGDPRYPLVATTFRLTEHHTAGGMSRTCRGWPSCSRRCSPRSTRCSRRARDRGRRLDGHRDRSAPRSRRARSVTERIRPLRVEGRLVHQVAMPWHWGFGGDAPGDSANDLGALAGRPERLDPGGKAFTCDVRAGRRRASRPRSSGVDARARRRPRQARRAAGGAPRTS